MKMNRIAIGLTVINLVLVTILLAQFSPAQAKEYKQPINSVLKGTALDIVDSLGRTRASISVLPPSIVDGKKYPQTVLLRLIDSKGKPIVKLSAAEDGSGLMLIDESDDGVILHARDGEGSIKFTSKGKEKIIKR